MTEVKSGYDPRVKKYYELLEEVEEKEKKIKFLQTEINRLNELNNELSWMLANNVDPFTMKEQGW